jgi:hypothetical protein
VLDRHGKRMVAAALVFLFLGVAAGLGPGQHGCSLPAQTRSVGVHELALGSAIEQYYEEVPGDCGACVLSAQFVSPGLICVAAAPPPRFGPATDTLELIPDSAAFRPKNLSRAPPIAASHHSTV